MSWVNVVRRMFSSRSDERGKLSFKLIVEAFNKSWLYIGSGSLKLNVSKNFINYVDKLKASGRLTLDAIEETIRETPSAVSYEYYECVRYGNKIVIPGSSLKGACRSRIELLQKADLSRRVGSCFIRAARPITRSPQKGHHGWRHYLIWNNVLAENRGSPCSTLGKEYYEDILVCNTCDVFGTSGLASKVYFGNLYSEDADVRCLTLDYNEKIEAIRPGANFTGELSFVSCSLVDIGLVTIGLNLYDENKPILIGKNKYKRRHVVDGPSDVKGKDIEFGILNVNPVEARFPSRFKGLLKEIIGVKEFSIDEYGFLVLNKEKLKALLKKAVEEALSNVPWIKDGLKINELEILRSQGVR